MTTSNALIQQICSKVLALSDADFSVAEASAKSQAEYRNPTNPEMESEVNRRGKVNQEVLGLLRVLRDTVADAPGGSQAKAIAQQSVQSRRRAS